MELAASLFGNYTPIFLMTAAFALVGKVIVERAGHDPILTGLLLLGNAVMIARFVLLAGFKASRARFGMDPARMVWWERAFAAGSFAFAACLGVFSARAIAIGTPAIHELTVSLLFGYGAGIVARMPLRPWISVPSLGMACIPPIGTLLSSGEIEHQVIAGLLAAFALGSLETTHYIYRLASSTIAMKLHLGDLARHDPLTGLPNRLVLDERLRAALALMPRGECLAVHFLDLDRFKPVNDRLGHAVGDGLLKAVGGRLEGLMRAGDLAARVGGDEFVVLQLGCTSHRDAEMLAARISRALHLPFDIAGNEIRIGATIGIAVAPEDGAEPALLLKAADTALNRQKLRGRGGYLFASASLPALAS